ncbi:hypothetical protein BN1184_BY_01400 [Pantoea ananatis]|nr:hypothetical protein BN1182_CQ_00180 [Pantoea ananatis]CRH36807.1 hypothetical protein BN1183_CN_00190 [Pantoea ananatis]CRH40413.1 hypothetical protein BN1184_BY_01400 [Pantoea ananatis]
MLSQAVIKTQRVVELFETLICCLGKASTPKCHVNLLQVVKPGAA